MLSKNLKIFTMLIGISTLFLGIAYATITGIDLNIAGKATAASNAYIKITSVEHKQNFDADLTTSQIISINKMLMRSKVVLGFNKDSYITYTVNVENNTNKDLYFIEVVKNNEFYTNENNEYNNIIVYETSGIMENEVISKNGGKLSFDITFKYNIENNEDITPGNNVLNSFLNFRFKEMHSISYSEGLINHDYPTIIVDGNDLVIEFIEDIPENLIVLGCDNYTYENNILTITNVKNDLVIQSE